MKRLLVVGGGLIGCRHVAEVKAHLSCELAGLVDPDPKINTPEGIKRFAQMQDVNGSIDGAIIATPTHLHADHATYAAQRGWHVLIEKPVAGDLHDARALATTIAEAGVGSLVGHHRRYHAPLQQLKKLLADGAIGRVVAVSVIWAARKPDSYFQANWRTAGGSPVMINLVHDIDVLRFVIGEITDVTALRGASERAADRIESGAVALAFANGATGTISFADTSPSPWGFEAGTGENPNIGTTGQDMMWVMGTSGSISFPSMTLWSGQDWGTAAQVQPLDVAHNCKSPLAAQLDHFVDVMDGASPLIDAEDATRTLDIALQIETALTAREMAA